MSQATHLSVRTTQGVERFRRGGIAFDARPTVIKIADLTAEQIDAIKGQPDMLLVEELELADVPVEIPVETDEPKRKRSRK